MIDDSGDTILDIENKINQALYASNVKMLDTR